MNSHISPSLLLANDSVPDSVKAAFKAAMKTPSASHAANRVVIAWHRLIDEAAHVSELQAAVLASMNDGPSVVGALLAREAELLAQLEAFRAAKREYQAKCDARRNEVSQLLANCAAEIMRLGDVENALRVRIAGFEQAQQLGREKLKDAGYSDDEIARIAPKPAEADRAEWRLEVARIRKRQAQLTAFVGSGPEFPESILAKPEAA